MLNRAYWKRALPIWILGVLLMYFYSGLQNDHINVLTPYFQNMGWSTLTITNPVTIAAIVVIPATVLVGTLMILYTVTRVLIVGLVLLAASCVGLALCGSNVVAYSIFLFLIRLLVLVLQMGAYMLCTNWFVQLRGRSLGIITIGCPLFTATGIATLSWAVNNHGFTMAYIGVGVVVLLVAVLTALFIKSSPEEVGLYPDGADCELASSTGEVQKIPLSEVLRNPGSWWLIISFGILQFCIVAMMAFYVPRLAWTGTEPAVYFSWLAAAAIMGMPISFILGVIDDKFGTVIASLVLSATFLVALFALLLMAPGKDNVPLIITAAIGLAGVTGGTPNLHPSITTYVWGRDKYQAANRWIMAIQAIMMAGALPFMSAIMDANQGNLDLAYKIMVGLVIVAIIFLVIIGRKPDYDRGNANQECGTTV